MNYDKLIKYYSKQREDDLRMMLRHDYGPGKYRIMRDGTVRAYVGSWINLGHVARVENHYFGE